MSHSSRGRKPVPGAWLYLDGFMTEWLCVTLCQLVSSLVFSAKQTPETDADTGSRKCLKCLIKLTVLQLGLFLSQFYCLVSLIPVLTPEDAWLILPLNDWWDFRLVMKFNTNGNNQLNIWISCQTSKKCHYSVPENISSPAITNYVITEFCRWQTLTNIFQLMFNIV